MAGLYFHIPFCFTRCGYCDFYKTTRLEFMDAFLKTLFSEVDHYKEDFNHPLSSIYFGGGTPSLVKGADFAALFAAVKSAYHLQSDAEITIEANPDDLTAEYLDDLLELGFNRISIGIQSFHQRDLQEMGRRHNAQQARNAVELAWQRGFRNIGMDLIYGLPWSSTAYFKQNLEIFTQLPVQHLSAYHLTFEEGTPFHRLLKKGIYQEVSEEDSLEQYHLLRAFTRQKGFEHYELSNFCSPGFRSRHNSSYWNGVPYLGFGPGAHSYFGNTRRWNKSDLNLYLQGDWTKVCEEEQLSEADAFNETLMLGLRTCEGLDLKEMRTRFPKFYATLMEQSSRWISGAALVHENDRLFCTPGSWFVVDGIIEDLFVSE
ncbi:radical SAM family heme chaperone HemW [Geofilum rhodophaeum]|uniref:radical SAM family heme chaperone HemW n=1 Tax=Geofilum rhodophaeum TaxID=1965019 RepID=UPI000B528137|nr:radical SAM family heme chaperone HemW [Geofilum rhodophaeum]